MEEDVVAKLLEERLCHELIEELGKGGDITLASPGKKRDREIESKSEKEPKDSKKEREKEKKGSNKS